MSKEIPCPKCGHVWLWADWKKDKDAFCPKGHGCATEEKITMSDLVKRLRDMNGGWASDEALAAADRIEELEAKQKKAAQYFAEIILHCANSGRGVPLIDERIIERCEDIAANAIEELAGGKDE